MASTTAIEWTNATWNPVTGCEKISDGCDNCYAHRFAERWRGVKGNYFATGFDLELRPNMLGRPSSWKKPRLIFVNSMSDLFHADVPNAYIDRVFEEMERTDHHVYQLLTKRPERMRRYIRSRYGGGHVPSQIWVGVTIESGRYGWRANMVREVNADVRFLSVEPMIGDVDDVDLDGIGWVICGGESGPGRRPINQEWVTTLRDRCLAAAIPFFFKQWHKAKSGRILEGRTWDEMPAH